MKKIYIAPSVSISKIDTNTLLAGSIGDGKPLGSGQPESDENGSYDPKINQFSKKHYNVWSDDEE